MISYDPDTSKVSALTSLLAVPSRSADRQVDYTNIAEIMGQI
jgi:hypothetical protein